MLPAEVRQAAANGSVSTTETIDPSQAADYGGHLMVGDLVPIPIGARITSLAIDQDVALNDESGRTMGTVCFGTRALETQVASMTRWQFAAYLADASCEKLSSTHDFTKDYVVLERDFAADYIDKYMATAPLWGGFTHDIPAAPHVRPALSEIVARQNIVLPTPHHRRSINRYVESVDAFDRFLKLYHTLELLFDFVTMKQFQALGNDLVGFGKIMSNYGSKELNRLTHIIMLFCDDAGQVAQALTLAGPHIERCQEIFQDHTKDGNPLKDDSLWTAFKSLAVASQLTASNISTLKVLNTKITYDKFIFAIAAYWIYRVRSSIAHSRVGEFLFTDADEPLIADFAEPLLLEIVRQTFSSAKLRALL